MGMWNKENTPMKREKNVGHQREKNHDRDRKRRKKSADQ